MHDKCGGAIVVLQNTVRHVGVNEWMNGLFEREWKAWAARHAAPEQTAWRWLADLTRRYSEPQRYYHDTSHIADLLGKFALISDRFERPGEVMAALYFHDAIYEIGRPDNEALSAELAREALVELGFTADATAHAAAMIEATVSHAATGDGDTDLFIDLDMSILAAPREKYALYASNVMAEFTTVYSTADYVVGRTGMFLEPSLNGERLFLTEHYRPQEDAARMNMEWEIEWLRGEAVIQG